MNIVYIGQYTPGTTSKMRADRLKHILSSSAMGDKEVRFDIIDTHVPFHSCHRFWRSMGFRYKRGPLIRRTNNYILEQISQLKNNSASQINSPKTYEQKPKSYTLIWIDKAIFLTPQTTACLKSLTDKLVHFTPDPAFTFHKSHLFRASLSIYDYAITTKAYELNYFAHYLKAEQIIYATQGFDKTLHQALTPFEEKQEGLLFIGHHEKERAFILQKLLDEGIPVHIAGIKWENFVKRNKENPYLHYHGKGIYGKDYVKSLSAHLFAWGAVSKWIPELHTTRTFEIPACGTALITERNPETNSFFTEDEAIFYDTTEEMIEKIKHYTNHPGQLETLTQKGNQRVHTDGRDYESILKEVITKIGV